MIAAFPLGAFAIFMTAEQRADFAKPGFLVGASAPKVAAAFVRDHRSGSPHLVPVVAVDLDTEPKP